MESRNRDRVEGVRGVVATHLPDYLIDSVALLGEGEDNIAYEVNGESILRFSKEPDPASRAAQVNHEVRLLAAVAGISPLPVPEPNFTVTEQGCLAYFKLPGVPLIDLPQPQR
jgi:aminoglycoside phosphotransferase (APT) family kinase protein